MAQTLRPARTARLLGGSMDVLAERPVAAVIVELSSRRARDNERTGRAGRQDVLALRSPFRLEAPQVRGDGDTRPPLAHKPSEAQLRQPCGEAFPPTRVVEMERCCRSPAISWREKAAASTKVTSRPFAPNDRLGWRTPIPVNHQDIIHGSCVCSCQSVIGIVNGSSINEG